MTELTTPRLLISGTGSGVGKSLITLGLVHAFKKQGLAVSACVVGPKLAHASILRRAVGRYVTALDDRILSAGQNLFQIKQASSGADILLLDGQRGVYDGNSPGSLRGSDAEMAALIKTPLVLICDARGIGNSIAALVHGYRDYAKGFDFAGVILNRVIKDNILLSKKEYDVSLTSNQQRPPLGVFPELKLTHALPSGVFTEAKNSTALERQFLVDLSLAVSAHVDIAAMTSIAKSAEPLALPGIELAPFPRRTRIAYTDDGCFNLCFQDNLELLRYFGAELVPFSPMADSELPGKIGGLYLTGGYVVEYGGEFAGNSSLRQSIMSFADSGGVIYSEGAGTALCTEEIHAKDERGEPVRIPGLGLIPAIAQHTPSVARAMIFKDNYVEGVTVEESVLGRTGLIVKGYATGEWRMIGDEAVVKVLRLSKVSSSSVHEGYSATSQAVGTLNFIHFGSNPEVAKNFVDAAEVHQKI